MKEGLKKGESSKPQPRAPPPDPRLKPGHVFVAPGGVKRRSYQGNKQLATTGQQPLCLLKFLA